MISDIEGPITSIEVELVTSDAPILNVLYYQINNIIEGEPTHDQKREEVIKWMISRCDSNKDFHGVDINEIASRCTTLNAYDVFFEICALFKMEWNDTCYFIDYKQIEPKFVRYNRIKLILDKLTSIS